MYIPFLPCILLQGPARRRQQRVAHAVLQMEEGRRTNQRYIDAANAEAARLAAERPAAEPPEAPHERDGTSVAAVRFWFGSATTWLNRNRTVWLGTTIGRT